MKPTPKKLDQQVIVILGASSGIGLATAEAAAKAGARLVLACRSEETMNRIVDRFIVQGTEAIFVPCDVSRREQVEAVAKAAIDRFGRIDTWINNAGLSIYGRLHEVSHEDHRRLFDINFWGVVHGSLVALEHLRAAGGAIINVGSEVSEAVVPLQGMYRASKHAVMGFTEALRVEVAEVDGAPVSITLIQPGPVDTPFPQHARNYLAREPKLPTPQIHPEAVAKAILGAAVRPTRRRKVGLMARLETALSKLAPGLAEKMGAKRAGRQEYDEPPRRPEGTLWRSGEAVGLSGITRGPGGKVA